jgi:hypothetical protein
MSSKDLLKVSLVLTLVASAGAAFAASDISTTTAIGTSTFSPSANVTISAASGTSSYSAYSQHLSGNRVYWGNNSDPKLYFGTKSTGSTIGYSPSSTDAAPTGFSSL